MHIFPNVATHVSVHPIAASNIALSTKAEQPIACAVPLFYGTDLGIFERLPAMPSRRVKGANLEPRKHCGRVEEGKRAARSSDCSAQGIGLAGGCQEDERRRSATGRVQKKEARRHHPGGQKAAVTGDEETLGRAQKEELVKELPC